VKVAPGSRLGPYEVLTPLGAGGMGEVYRAMDSRLDRMVALKVLPEEFFEDEERTLRFEREAKAVAALSHPNILSIFDFGKDAGIPYAVMELLEGQTLRERLDEGRIPQRQAVDYALQVARGLSAAHLKGVIHRDLKPENLFVVKGGHVKILDFGLAKRSEAVASSDSARASTVSGHTEPGTVVGTVGYMSPEQVRGLPVDARADIFAFGAILYEMLTGRRAFHGATPADTLSAILREDPPEFSRDGTEFSPALERVVRHCLERNREERFESARDLAFALREAGDLSVSSQGSKAPARPRGPRISGWPLAVVGAIALLAALLVADVGGLRRRLLPGAAAARIESVAVLPLANLSGDSQQDYFADGMTEELIADLAKISALRVTSRTSVMRYKGSSKSLPEIAQELGVDAVVEGSVTRAGSQVKITAQLIDAAKDRHLWADSFQRELKDVLALQGEVARAIAGEIGVRLTPQERSRLANRKSVNPEAYEAYLKGNYHLFRRTASDARKSLEYFQDAVKKQPDYALAYGGIAQAYETEAGSVQGALSPKEAFPKAKEAAMRALELDPTLGEPYALLGWSSFVFDRDWTTAESQFQKALQLSPNDATAHDNYAMFLSRMGRFDEALGEMKRAQELDPVSLGGNTRMGIVLSLARRDDEAIPWFRRALAMDPSFLGAHFGLGLTLVHKGEYEEAISELQKAVELSGGGAAQLGALGFAYAVANRRVEALEIAEKLTQEAREHYVPPSSVAIVFSGLGDRDQAMTWLEKAIEERDPWLTSLKVHPAFDPLRSDPRFLNLLHRVGLN
jgi:serine/threonine protein kinase/TolB-like protein/Tfp pilus assembly protein PilF